MSCLKEEGLRELSSGSVLYVHFLRMFNVRFTLAKTLLKNGPYLKIGPQVEDSFLTLGGGVLS